VVAEKSESNDIAKIASFSIILKILYCLQSDWERIIYAWKIIKK
jgi:hypothetical protein